MAKLMLHRNLLKNFGKLPAKVQKKISEWIDLFQTDPYDPGIGLHALQETMIDPKVRGADLPEGTGPSSWRRKKAIRFCWCISTRMIGHMTGPETNALRCMGQPAFFSFLTYWKSSRLPSRNLNTLIPPSRPPPAGGRRRTVHIRSAGSLMKTCSRQGFPNR